MYRVSSIIPRAFAIFVEWMTGLDRLQRPAFRWCEQHARQLPPHIISSLYICNIIYNYACMYVCSTYADRYRIYIVSGCCAIAKPNGKIKCVFDNQRCTCTIRIPHIVGCQHFVQKRNI